MPDVSTEPAPHCPVTGRPCALGQRVTTEAGQALADFIDAAGDVLTSPYLLGDGTEAMLLRVSPDTWERTARTRAEALRWAREWRDVARAAE